MNRQFEDILIAGSLAASPCEGCEKTTREVRLCGPPAVASKGREIMLSYRVRCTCGEGRYVKIALTQRVLGHLMVQHLLFASRRRRVSRRIFVLDSASKLLGKWIEQFRNVDHDYSRRPKSRLDGPITNAELREFRTLSDSAVEEALRDLNLEGED